MFYRLLLFSILFCAGVKAQDTTKHVIYKWDLFRAIQGTFQISREQKLVNNKSLNIGLMGTYASTRGLAKPYLKAQEFSYKDATTNTTYNLDDIQVLGFGIDIQLRKYLAKNKNIFSGFYIAPEIFYRKLFLESSVFVNNTQSTINRKLDLGYIGYSVGYQKIYKDMLTIDGYLGGGLFLSKYNDESTFTKFRTNYQLDYSGIYFNMGVLVGILR
jgi:hypothetical protein